MLSAYSKAQSVKKALVLNQLEFRTLGAMRFALCLT